MKAWRCRTCGELHDDLPDLGTDKPDPWWTIPESERAQRIELTRDTCVIDNKEFFIRGVVEIPVHDYHREFGIGVWVSQNQEHFETYVANPHSNAIGPFFGWLCTRLACYPVDTYLLKTRAHFRGELRPFIELEPTQHPLAVDQMAGITLEKAWEMVHYYEKPGGVTSVPKGESDA